MTSIGGWVERHGAISALMTCGHASRFVLNTGPAPGTAVRAQRGTGGGGLFRAEAGLSRRPLAAYACPPPSLLFSKKTVWYIPRCRTDSGSAHVQMIYCGWATLVGHLVTRCPLLQLSLRVPLRVVAFTPWSCAVDPAGRLRCGVSRLTRPQSSPACQNLDSLS